MKSLLLILFLSVNAYAYPLGIKGNGLTTKYPALIDLGTLTATNSGSTVTVGSIPQPVTTAQMNAIVSPAVGRTVYNTDFKAIASYDGTKWVYGFGFLNLDNTFSAKASAANPSVISDENIDWINGNCTNSGTNNSIKTCLFNSGIFTVAPNCVITTNSTSGIIGRTISTTASQVQFQFFLTSNNAADAGDVWQFICQKQGADYLSASSNAYASTNANTDWASYTPALGAGFGTVSGLNAKWRRVGDTAEVSVAFTMGTTAASLGTISLPNGISADSAKLASISGTQVVGHWQTNGGNTLGTIIVSNSDYSLAYTGGSYNSANMFGGININTTIGSGAQFEASFRVPISGWAGTPFIVGSFQGYNSTLGLNNPKIYSAKISSGGVVSDETGNWINGNCTTSSPYTCTFNSGTFATLSNCQVTVKGEVAASVRIISESLNSVQFRTIDTLPATVNAGVNLQCHGE